MTNEIELRQKYGSFYAESRQVDFESSVVPRELWPLVPYARFWGICDDLEREQLAEKAPQEIREELKILISVYDDLLDEWLAGEEATSQNPSDAYIAFSAMRMCADYM